MRFFHFFTLFSSFLLVVWGATSGPSPSRRNAFSLPPSNQNIDGGEDYGDGSDLGADLPPPPQRGLQQRRGPIAAPDDLGDDDGLGDDLSDAPGGDDLGDDVGPPPALQRPSRQQGLQQGRRGPGRLAPALDDLGNDGGDDSLDAPGGDGLGDDSEGSLPQVPYRRQGFQRRQGAKGPERLASPGLQEGGEDLPEDTAGFSEEPLPEQAELPPRNYPPKRPELQFGQTGWNQLDLHSLVKGRGSY